MSESLGRLKSLETNNFDILEDLDRIVRVYLELIAVVLVSNRNQGFPRSDWRTNKMLFFIFEILNTRNVFRYTQFPTGKTIMLFFFRWN